MTDIHEAAFCSDVCRDKSALGELGGSASDVTRALNELLNHVKDGHADRIPDIMEQVCPLYTSSLSKK